MLGDPTRNGACGGVIVANMGCCCCNRRDDCTTPYSSVYDITVKDLDGNPLKLSQFQGQVIMIVNVASK